MKRSRSPTTYSPNKTPQLRELSTTSEKPLNPPNKISKMAAPQPILSATYTSPTNAPFTLALPISAPIDNTNVESKTKYLSDLRQSVTSLQDQVNKELTARMEEDKAREAAAANGAKMVDDEKEEENYGEEVVEEED
jgi:hypothetical protein